ncbi:general secretion pathway protein GspB [Comamonas flocculans]|uniref:Type II secretion system protein GspB C-terminal domain-containing protein n=1 Tax=Comamonas flocculans TaxID=2597701 RepID=A0A5B8RVD5_9BURK|nr:general secretion pathway protein GspB [Comamonas flocculans]QEA12624.1 hypothetical protein FOZ74_06035 [Comamonas flocculans]
MSTILDALRRAEHERQRGSVPSLHAQAPLLAGMGGARDPVRAPRWPWALALLATAALAAGLAWRLASTQPAADPQPRTAVQGRLPDASASASAPAPASASSAAADAGAPAPDALAPAVPPAPRKRAAARSAAAGTAPKPAGVASAAAAPPVPLAGIPAAPPAHASKAPPAPATGSVFAPQDLPASVRAALPGLHLAGVTWSDDRRLRMAIVNGQVLHEGEAAAPGLVLQSIEQTRTVWAFQGYRVALPAQ